MARLNLHLVAVFLDRARDPTGINLLDLSRQWATRAALLRDFRLVLALSFASSLADLP